MTGRWASIAALVTMTCTPPAASQSWNGRYVYEHDGGRTAGGDRMLVDYLLVVTDKRCRLTVSGFQTDETILCSAADADGRLDVAFAGYGDGRAVNRYGVSVYRVGEPLLSLSWKGGTLITAWRRYSPEDEYPTPARYFRKVPGGRLPGVRQR